MNKFLNSIENISIQSEKDAQREIALHEHLTKTLKEKLGYDYIVGVRYGRNIQAFLELETDKFNSNII